MTADPVVVVPGDLDVEDRLAGPVTFRMAAWLAAAAAGVALVAASHGTPALIAVGVLLVVVGVVGAWWRPGGRPVAAWLAPLVAYRRRRRGHSATEVPQPNAPIAPSPAEQARTSVPRVRWFPAVAVVVAGVVGVFVFVGLGGAGARPAPATQVPAAVPDSPASPREPVVVVVPVDPFAAWEVDDDGLGLWCGC